MFDINDIIDQVKKSLPGIDTGRLLLRKVSKTDVKDIFEYAQDAEVSKYTSWSPHKAIEDSSAYIEKLKTGKEITWIIEHQADKKAIGSVGFVNIYPTQKRGEIGYALSRKYWNQGLMTEAVKKIVEFGFETFGFERIEGICFTENIGSARVMEKAGMQQEGVLRRFLRKDGVSHDVKIYSAIR